MNNSGIIVSFCIPTYNRVNFVIDCIEQIQKIDSQFIEIIVVDNLSSDETEERVKEKIKYDSRLKYYINDENIGQSRNIIRVLSLARGKYLYLTSDEDLVNPDFFKKYMEEIEKNDYSFIFGSIFDLVSKRYYVNEKDFFVKNLSSLRRPEKIAYRFYLSGLIFNAHYLDFKRLEFYTTYQDNLYSYIPAILMCIRHGSIKSYKETICFKQQALIQYTDYDLRGIKLHYTSPISRARQINFWKKITIELINQNSTKKKLLFGLSRSAFNIANDFSYSEYDKSIIENFKKKILIDKELKNGFLFANAIYNIKSILKKLILYTNYSITH